jgi:hypothetical protein
LRNACASFPPFPVSAEHGSAVTAARLSMDDGIGT